MTTPLVILGCGGFGREVWSIARAINAIAPKYELLGVLDDDPSVDDLRALERCGGTVLGGLAWLDAAPAEVHAAIGIGSPKVRRKVDLRWPERNWSTLIHPHTTIGAGVHLSPGVVVAPGARISTSVTIGRHAHLDQNVTVGHDCVLGDYTRLNPQACTSGHVTIAEGATVGANATVLQGLHIGSHAVVGAGAVVTRAVDDDRIVKGVPAK